MLNLTEYRGTADRLADHLPWAALVAPGVVLNKDGSFQRTLRFRGPDLESATEAELVSICARANNALRRLGSGWALFFDAERIEALEYPDSIFPDPASWLVDEERRAHFDGRRGQHFESRYHLTLCYLPTADQVSRAERALLERDGAQEGRDWRQELRAFVAETDRVLDLLSGFMKEVRALDDSETLTFLHGCISPKRHPVTAPDTPMYLDGLLVDTALSGGIEPMLGDWHLRTVTVMGFPNSTHPGILDALNHQAFAYRWATRFIALDKTAANKALTRIRRQWFNKRKSIAQLMREVMMNEPVPLTDSDADNKVADADLALQALGGDHVAFGYYTATITVSDADRAAVEEKVRVVERIVNGLGFTCIRESVNAVEAWLSSLPGHVYANVRQPLVHTLNLAHLMPLSSVWAGPARNEHLDGPPLLYAETSGSTPFRLTTHAGDVGHTFIAGPTGSGKSVLLALLALQFRRYPGSQIFAFDFGGSMRAAALAMGGDWHDLGGKLTEGRESSVSLQPLARIHEIPERAWAADWLVDILRREGVEITPEVKEHLWSALTSLASAPVGERTFTGLSVLLQSNALKQALQPYCIGGAYGRLLDADSENLGEASVQVFETDGLIDTGGAAATLAYLFHRISDRLDGRPTIIVVDEGWLVALNDPGFAKQLTEWLVTLRKKNASVIFATQSLAQIGKSAIAAEIIDSCHTRLLLPNDRAIEPQITAVYRAFGLNDRQIELVARATPKRHYYLQSQRGNRLFELALGPVALALCGASDPDSHRLIDDILARHGREGFLPAFLEARGLAWAADLIPDLPNPKQKEFDL